MSGVPAVKAKVSLSSSLSFVERESGVADLHGFRFREIHGAKSVLITGSGGVPGSNNFPIVASSLAVSKSGVNPKSEIDQRVKRGR